MNLLDQVGTWPKVVFGAILKHAFGELVGQVGTWPKVVLNDDAC